MSTIAGTYATTTQLEMNAANAGPGGYRITHIFQMQDDDGANDGQYTQTVDVEYWDDIGVVIERWMCYPDTAGYTRSITVEARND